MPLEPPDGAEIRYAIHFYNAGLHQTNAGKITYPFRDHSLYAVRSELHRMLDHYRNDQTKLAKFRFRFEKAGSELWIDVTPAYYHAEGDEQSDDKSSESDSASESEEEEEWVASGCFSIYREVIGVAMEYPFHTIQGERYIPVDPDHILIGPTGALLPRLKRHRARNLLAEIESVN